MKAQLERLIQLQETDTRLSEIHRRKSDLPILMEQKRAAVNESDSRLTEARARLDEIATLRRAKERELTDREDRIAKFKAKQSEIKTNKEYQAFLAEIETGKEEIGRIEEELLEIMDRSEEMRREISRAEQAHQEVLKSFEAAKSALEAESSSLDADLARLEEGRAVMQETIQPELLKSYRQILSVKKDAAVVAVQNGICAGCHMNVPPQLVANVRKHDKVLTCLNCHRILYDVSLCAKPA